MLGFTSFSETSLSESATSSTAQGFLGTTLLSATASSPGYNAIAHITPDSISFSGIANTIEFDAPESFISSSDSIVMDLGAFDATAEVSLNGKLLAYAWMPNTELAISGILKQENTLEITVADVCRNRFIGDLIQFGEVKSLFTTSPIATILNKDMPLKHSGLMGPVKLAGYKKQVEK